MPWWQEETLHHWVHRLLPKSMRYLIGQKSQEKVYCFSLMRLMPFYASKLFHLQQLVKFMHCYLYFITLYLIWTRISLRIDCCLNSLSDKLNGWVTIYWSFRSHSYNNNMLMTSCPHLIFYLLLPCMQLNIISKDKLCLCFRLIFLLLVYHNDIVEISHCSACK